MRACTNVVTYIYGIKEINSRLQEKETVNRPLHATPRGNTEHEFSMHNAALKGGKMKFYIQRKRLQLALNYA